MSNNPKSQSASTQSFLPIKEIRNGIVVLKDGGLRTVIMVKASGFDLKSEAEQEAIIRSFEGFLNSLNSPLQILVRSKRVELSPYLEELKKRAAEETNDLLANQIENYVAFIEALIENYNIMSKSFYIVLSHQESEAKPEKVSFWKNIFGPPKITPRVDFEKAKIAVFEKTDIMVNQLNAMGLRAIQLNTQELIELFYTIYNPETAPQEKIINTEEMTAPLISREGNEAKLPQLPSPETKALFEKGLTSIRDIIAPPSMEIEQDYLRVGNKFVRILFTYSYPRYLFVNWLGPIINLDKTIDISMFIYPVESRVVMENLRKKVGQMEATLAIEAEKGKVRNPKIEAALKDAEMLRDRLQLGTERFFHFCLYFALYADDKKELDKLTKNLENILGGMLVYTKHAILQMEQGFNSVLPINHDELYVPRNMDTMALGTCYPFTSSELTQNKGILYGYNPHNNTLIIFDRFKLENANMVVFAKAGAGKSFAVKLEALRSLMLGTEIIIIDPEEEYKTLCEAVDGLYIDVSLTSDKRINPFDLPKVIDVEEEKDRLRGAIGNLHGLMNLMLGKLTPEEEAIMDRALIETYALKDITFDPATQNKEPPLLSDLEEVLSNMEGAGGLTQRLRRYTEGTFAGLFNRPTNVNLENRFIVFSLRNLEDVLRPIAMYMIINFIWNKIRSELKKRILIIDEAWHLMQYEDSAKFIMGIAKRCRKYYLGLTTITQDVEDFLKGEYGKPIITNSALQLLLKQSPAAIDYVADVFKLTEGEKYYLLQCNIGEGIFFAGPNHVAIHILPSYLEEQLITTNPEQLLEIQAAKKETVASLGE